VGDLMENSTDNQQQILIYETDNGDIQVTLTEDTVWLTLNQLAEVFDRDKSVISRHLKNIFDTKELEKSSVVAKNATTAADGKTYQIAFYNLDAVISVGYRVNSNRATRFRKWATAQLTEYLVHGYSLNEQLLEQHQNKLKHLENTLRLFQRNVIDQANLDEAKGLVSVITDYTRTFVLLNQFDSERLPDSDFSQEIRFEIKYSEARAAIDLLQKSLIAKNEATYLVGNEKDESFEGILGNIVQSFDGEYLYPSIEEQAAHLLYFVIKNHPFSDGNKRIGAFLFIWFLQRNEHHLKKSGELKINDNALAAIALLVAQSAPNQKTLMIQLIMNLVRTET